MFSGSLDDLRAVPASIEESDHPGHASHTGQRHCPSRVDTDLQCVAISPHWQQPGLQRWSHNPQRDRRYRQSRHCGRTRLGRSAAWPGSAAWLVRGLAGVPGHRSDMASSRSLRCGPFGSLPQKRRAAWSPGTPALAKLGLVSKMVNTCLWMAMWTTWGAAGVSLWTVLRHSCEVPDRQACRARCTWAGAVHPLWTKIVRTSAHEISSP